MLTQSCRTKATTSSSFFSSRSEPRLESEWRSREDTRRYFKTSGKTTSEQTASRRSLLRLWRGDGGVSAKGINERRQSQLAKTMLHTTALVTVRVIKRRQPFYVINLVFYPPRSARQYIRLLQSVKNAFRLEKYRYGSPLICPVDNNRIDYLYEFDEEVIHKVG